MIQLLKKDFRVYRMVFLGVATLWTVGPAMTWIAWLLRDTRVMKYPGDYVATMGSFGLFLSIVFAAMLGGSAFAAERRDKTADFLAMVPVKRTKIIASKLILSAGVIAALWIIALGTLYLGMVNAPDIRNFQFANRPGQPSDANPFVALMSISLMAFGAAWFFSVILKDPLASTVLALLEIGAIMTFVGFYVSWYPMPDPEAYWIFITIPLGVGLISWIGGTYDYLRRVEP